MLHSVPYYASFWILLLCLASPQAVRTEPYNSSSSLTLTDDVIPSDLLLLASEETPTRAPTLVTKQGYAKKEGNVQKSENPMETTKATSEDPGWVTDCSEPLNKDISCSVNIIGCSDNVFKYVDTSQEPPRAHDVRIAPTTKVVGANRIDKRKHRLHVDVSWQIPQLNSSSLLKAFKLIVSGPEGKNTCFVFNVTHAHFEDDDSISPRYRFSSNTLFEFGHNYTVTVLSLPLTRKRAQKVSATSSMPDDPDEIHTKFAKTDKKMCEGKSNPQASKWAASFRKIFLFSAIRMIQIEFLAAPPQYCFEEYEIRLLDTSGIVMLDHALIKKEDLRTEIINGHPVQFGEYNFTDIELDTDIIPSVIPIETAHDGRCLCETENGCSCLAADWKPVKLTKIEKPPAVTNLTEESDKKAEESKEATSTWTWHIYALFGSVSVAIIFLISICFGWKCYKRIDKTRKASNIYLMTENPTHSHSSSIPLIMKQSISVLILYSHDSAQHEAAVLAFAELLKNVFDMKVHLDEWDEDDIDANRAEYINSSIVRANKVIIINSVGAYFRTLFRHQREPPIERIVPGRNDMLFDLQCELALQHPCVISCHFNYTNPKYVFFPVNRLLQYSIPDSLSTLTTALTGQTARAEQLAGFNQVYARLQAAISRKLSFIEGDPQWFENSHHRVAPRVEDPNVIPLPKGLEIRIDESKSSFGQLETIPIDEMVEKYAVAEGVVADGAQLLDDETTNVIQKLLVKPELREDVKSLDIPSTSLESAASEIKSPRSSDDVHLDEEIEEELGDDELEDDVDSVDGQTARIEELHRLIVNKDMNHDSGNLDSAYVSGSDFSADIHNDILDKPRISAEKERRKSNREDSAFHDDVIGVH